MILFDKITDTVYQHNYICNKVTPLIRGIFWVRIKANKASWVTYFVANRMVMSSYAANVLSAMTSVLSEVRTVLKTVCMAVLFIFTHLLIFYHYSYSTWLKEDKQTICTRSHLTFIIIKTLIKNKYDWTRHTSEHDNVSKTYKIRSISEDWDNDLTILKYVW